MKGEGISGGSEKFDANTDGLAIRDESESFDYVKASPEIHIDLTATDEKILKSELAKNVLPYLTLNELSEHEKAETLRLAGRVLDFTNMDYLNILKLKDSMHEISGTRPDSRPSDDIKLGETNKLFWGFFLEGLCTYENSSTEGIEIKALMPTVLWGKPFASYNCCGLEGQLELLSIAERSKNPLVKTIYKEIINEQASSKSDENIFQKILEDATPIKQLQMLPVMSNISNFYEDGDKKTRAAS